MTELRDLLRSLGVSDVRMEEGSLRCDVNTSLSPARLGPMGHPDRDQERQLAALGGAGGPVRDRAAGRRARRRGRVIQETRHFHEDSGTTTPGRSKEEAQDYRYFPEPDLVPLAPPPDWVEQIRAALPEPPAARRARLQAEWGLSEPDMTALPNAGALDLVAETVAAGASPADARKWWLGELARRANDAGAELAGLAITPAQVARVAALVASGALNDRLARQVIDARAGRGGHPDEVVAARGLAVVSDDGALAAAVDAGHRRQPRRRRQGPRRQGRRGRRPGRRGHEGHPRPGRRRPRPRADPGPPQLARPLSPSPPLVRQRRVVTTMHTRRHRCHNHAVASLI